MQPRIKTHATRWIKRVSPSLYGKAVKFLSSESVRTVRALHTMPAENRMIRQNAPLFAVDIHGRTGLGALMSISVGVLGYAEQNGLQPRLRFSNPLYALSPEEDWLDRCFVRQPWLCPAAQERELPADRYVKASVNLMRRLRPIYAGLSLQHSHELFLRGLQIRESLQEEANEFCRIRGVNADTVGLHFRGTDKYLEATVVQWDQMADAAQRALDGGKTNLFVATDEPGFLRYMNDRFGPRMLDLDCKEIFTDGPAHYTAGDPVRKAREALLTMLVLSRCGLLIRTRSHLSAWAKILNPEIPTVVFGEMLKGDQFRYPEHLVTTEISL